MKKRIQIDANVYEDGFERRTLDLRPDGIDCIPVLGLSNFQSVRTGTEEHVHPGCVEICLCIRGRLFRLFPATERVKGAFERMFALYDAEPRGASRHLKLKSAALELLLALVEAPHAAQALKRDLDRRKGLDPNRIGIMGSSAGGHLTLMGTGSYTWRDRIWDFMTEKGFNK